MRGKKTTSAVPDTAITPCKTANQRMGRITRWPLRAAKALPSANPAIKLANTTAVAHTLLPKLKPSRLNHRDSKINAEAPDTKKIRHRIVIISLKIAC